MRFFHLGHDPNVHVITLLLTKSYRTLMNGYFIIIRKVVIFSFIILLLLNEIEQASKMLCRPTPCAQH